MPKVELKQIGDDLRANAFRLTAVITVGLAATVVMSFLRSAGSLRTSTLVLDFVFCLSVAVVGLTLRFISKGLVSIR